MREMSNDLVLFDSEEIVGVSFITENFFYLHIAYGYRTVFADNLFESEFLTFNYTVLRDNFMRNSVAVLYNSILKNNNLINLFYLSGFKNSKMV